MNAAKRQLIEVWVGAAITVAIVATVVLVFGPTSLGDGSYEVTARFSRADGVRVGTSVRAAGVPVGQLRKISLDDDFRAVAVLQIDRGVVLDTDATAAIVTDGLFGDKFIQLDIGGADRVIGDGAEITITEDSLVLDDLLELIISQARQAKRAVTAPPEDVQ